MRNLVVVRHPIVQEKLTQIRDKGTNPRDFRGLVEQLAVMLFYEATRDLPLRQVGVATPLGPCRGFVLDGNELALVPILRAGLAMAEGVLRLLPGAVVGHLGIYREEQTLQPIEYYWKLPPGVDERLVVVLDPMLATGGSARAAVDFLKKHGARQVRLVCLIAAPEGVEHVHGAHPDVDIYTAAVDERLNAHGYIVPGLGDAGDRLYGTG